MIDFATLQGVTIPEGVVTQIESGGVVLWKLNTGGGAIVLEVAKYTSNTYAGETAYENEQFILLDIYPKTNGTVSVTYGGLTKTITDTSSAAEPNAQQVFFGTFNGVSDSVETPASGTLTIEGDCAAFGCGSFVTDSKGSTRYGNFIMAVSSFGSVADIPASAFKMQFNFAIQELPKGIETIGDYAFAMVAVTTSQAGDSMNSLLWSTAMEGGEITLPSTVKSIGSYAFTSERALSTSSGGSADTYPCYLAKVKILATQPPSLGAEAFGKSYGGFGGEANFMVKTFEVPKGFGDAYKAAEGWSSYATRIVEAS